ncbi:MAG: ABC transporter substrate-binding protein [Lachnospiraceae bacterium]|nr:ABC transporter substrate-binding protein [Lachnospiraceae bacterium]
MKKAIAMLLSATIIFSLAACGSTGKNTASEDSAPTAGQESESASDSGNEKSDSSETGSNADADSAEAEKPETILINSVNAESEKIQLEVPYDPQRIVVIDMACLDILTSLGLEDRIVGTASTSLDYLVDYVKDVPVVGTIKSPDLEAIMECEPDLIFMGGRGAEYYETLSEIAPTVRVITDVDLGLVESVTVHSKEIASVFGLEDEIDAKVAGFGERIDALREFASGKTMILGMCTSGSFNVMGDDGRCSIIGTEVGFTNIGVKDDVDTATHGNEASFEYIVQMNPEYIFVMDRDAAIGTDGAQLAKDIMENELVQSTDCYKNGNLIILEHPAVWYTGEGGITALDLMIQDLETALLK